ncbi:glutathione S-transferase [Rubricella aquisinus]|uniref:Glutathione S-transferase n=1 Tax=Rubricella aquisinus TaxID=2028108 RepID=A0A840X038_9RHOB|nr:glutathione S-transferase family protein [Rubricella aquisinus]MBB5516084.1 glutathione S-transferase [Rubricella aquisinus]
MADYTLHCFAQSGNAYKPALMLALTGCNWEAEFVDFFGGAARDPAFLAINEMGEVPVLDHGDVRLTQSGVMLDYIAEQTGQFEAKTDAERREVMRWLLWDNHKGSTQQGMTRFLINFLPEKHRNADVIAFAQGRVVTALKVLERHLAKQDWLAADRPTIADISACGYLYYPEPFGYDAATFPAIAAWLERIKGLPGWQHPYDLMPGHPLEARG